MGVKHFYPWYKRHCAESITHCPKSIDVLALDLNGMFHLCAQKIYTYGTRGHSLLAQKHMYGKTNILLFKEICNKIERLRYEINPKKKLILCVDGVAGLGKMNQQRQRRFKTGLTMDVNAFNPNSFTPGTKLMDHLTKYIDWYIRTMMTTSKAWQNLDVIFSNEKVPGEGEHKIMYYIRRHARAHESFCIYGLDADLIMIGLLLPLSHVYIAREPDYGFIEYVHLKTLQQCIVRMMRWTSHSHVFQDERAIDDFILMTFLVGNDFLPTLPTVSIIDGALDIVLEIYKNVGRQCGHLTREVSSRIIFERHALFIFFQNFAMQEKALIEKKYNSQYAFFPDPLVLRNLRIEQNKNVISFPRYRDDYYRSKFRGNASIHTIVKEYLDGMNWIINYYKFGMPDWTWFYPFFYGPFLVDFVDILETYESPLFHSHEPLDPFLQLIMVLPENSKSLVPSELSDVSLSLKQYFPDIIEIDLTGKRKEWEGVMILPIIHLEDFRHFYIQRLPTLHPIDKKRNIRGKNFVYSFNPMKRDNFSSFYGNIYDCPVVTTILDF